MKNMAHSSSKASLSPRLPSHRSPHFTPIRECEREESEDEEFQERTNFRETPNGCTDKREVESKHQPTPLHQPDHRGKASTRRRSESDDTAGDDRGVSCNKCRPSSREKISVVPLDNSGINRHSIASPNGIFKSIFSSLIKRSPRSSDASSTTAREEQWKIAVAELSHKLIQATRKRDEALLEASKNYDEFRGNFLFN
uniref:Uncharacterized protein n=1 Tax=Davidia involucrata TaxID=16924 RepID=A0A5B7B0L2_DAVIN